jgi:hypothetical protein
MKYIAESQPREGKRGRPYSSKAGGRNAWQSKYRARKRMERIENIAILDMETDPFDAANKSAVYPFLAVLYSEKFEPIIIWDEDHARLAKKVYEAIETLPGKFTIYAHNGGRFDYMFLVHQFRGRVHFKGRGIMLAKIGEHELRDSFHIIPERLANWQKDSFDYAKVARSERQKYKAEIIKYCLNDCRYLLDIVRSFAGEFGIKLSIGQAAMAKLKEHYDVKKFSDCWDTYIRQFYFGGRVQCLTGRQHLIGNFKLYDVNSMYPYVMATYKHPIGDFFSYRMHGRKPNADTVFIDLECDNNNALIKRNENLETVATEKTGRFFTTIWEYRTALKYKLIENVRINYCIDCSQRTNFSKFVLPLYQRRQQVKGSLKELEHIGQKGSTAYNNLKKDDIFLKLLLNNAYGKFAQNPRNYKEHYLTDPNERPPIEWFKSIEKMPADLAVEFMQPSFECERYSIWEKPNPSFRFNNVGTAASITGAARAVLLEALQCADDPIYCDTDSVICRQLYGLKIDPVALGAWDLEDEYSELIINGKKLYACRRAGANGQTDEFKIRTKGVSGVSWTDMLALYEGAAIPKINKAPTLTRYSEQSYMVRMVKATAPLTMGN